MKYIDISFNFLLQKFINRKNLRKKQIPLKKTLGFLFLDFLRGIATAIFRKKHIK